MSGDKVLVLGAGMVAGPLVEYLLEGGFQVTVASRTVSKAQALVEGWSKGGAKHLNAKDTGMMREEIRKHHLTVSLLPPRLHTVPARICTEEGKPMVTTSYVSEEMEKLDKKAKEAGVILLNELGVDPGIDHMSAVKTIDEIHRKGGQVKSFKSYCGALPAPEESFNPLGYKFSWRPKGVLHASTNPARFLINGQEMNIDGPDLFANYSFKEIGGLGYFEEYPNRDSFPYIDKYGISETETIYRGTLRKIGWCETLKKIVELGYLGGDKKDLEGMTYRDFTGMLLNYNGNDLKRELSEQLKLDTYSTVLKTFEWLGMMSEEDIPLKRGSALEVLATLMESKLAQKKGRGTWSLCSMNLRRNIRKRRTTLPPLLSIMEIRRGFHLLPRQWDYRRPLEPSSFWKGNLT